VALSVAGHLAGGGNPPDLAHAPVAVLGLVVVTALLCLALGWASGRRWTFGRAALALGLGQAVLHTAFALVLVPAGHPGGPASGAVPHLTGMTSPSGMAGTGGMPGMTAGTPPWSSGSAFSMAAGHTVAALVVAAVIARTDSALGMWCTVSTARTLALRAVRQVVRAVGAAARRAEEHPVPLRRPASAGCTWLLRPAPRQRVDGRGLSRRGPPRPV